MSVIRTHPVFSSHERETRFPRTLPLAPSAEGLSGKCFSCIGCWNSAYCGLGGTADQGDDNPRGAGRTQGWEAALAAALCVLQGRGASPAAEAHRDSREGFTEQRGLKLIGSFIWMFKIIIIIKNPSLNGFLSPQAIQAAARFPFGLKILSLICYKNLHAVEMLLESLRWEGHTFVATRAEGISLSSSDFWEQEWE